MRVIQEVTPIRATELKRLRVCAYARVSSGKDTMLHSLSTQVSYYQKLIASHIDWIFCGIYADEAFTGTKDNRVQFQKMLEECRRGNIQLIVTKSISRFARNTITLLQTVRELKSIGVDVYFEEQNIHTLSADGELMLSILASYAQEESRSASENQKWRIRRNFENGMPWNGTMLGYRYEEGTLVVEPTEAEIVSRIFTEYLGGSGMTAIAKRLNADGIPTRFGNDWGKTSVGKVLHCDVVKKAGYLLFSSDVTNYEISEIGRINDIHLAFFSGLVISPVLKILVKLALRNEDIAVIKDLAVLVSSLGKACKITYCAAGILHGFSCSISFRHCVCVSIFRLEKSISYTRQICDLIPHSKETDDIVAY